MKNEDLYLLNKDCVENFAGTAIEDLMESCMLSEIEAMELLKIYFNKAV